MFASLEAIKYAPAEAGSNNQYTITTSRYWLIVSRIVEAQNPADTLDHSRIRQLGLSRRMLFENALQMATPCMSNEIPIAAEASKKNSLILIIPPAPTIVNSTPTTKARHTNSRMPSARDRKSVV